MEQLKVRLAVIRGKDHSLYEEILASPPDGVEYVTDGPAAPEGSAAKGPGFVSVLRRNGIVRAVLDPQFVRALPRPGEPPGGISFSVARNLTRLAGGSASKGKEAVPFDVLHSAGSSHAGEHPLDRRERPAVGRGLRVRWPPCSDTTATGGAGSTGTRRGGC